MSTWAEWIVEVKRAFQGSPPSHHQLIFAVKDGALATMARDTESDLALAKSYRDSFRDARLDLAGTGIDDGLEAFVAEVRNLTPIAADTEAMSDVLNNAIRNACNILDDDAERFLALVQEAAIEMQRHVPFFQLRQENSYVKNSTGLTNEAFVSRVAPPEGMRLTQMWFGKYYAALAEGVTYAAGDFVESNDRIYKVVTGGALEAGELADGLTSTDGEAETLGDLVFNFYAPVILVPARAYPWIDRARLRAGRFSGGPLYSLSKQFDELWFFPALDDDHRFVMEWVGVKQTWAEDDEVTFDQKAASCAAHFARSALLREILGDSRRSAEEFALFQRDLRGLVIDCEQRDTGMTQDVAAYQYWNRSWAGCFPCRGGSSGGGGGGTPFSLTSGFSDTITTLAQLADLATVNTDVPIYLTFWNSETETLQTWKLIASTEATGPGYQRPTDFDAGTNSKVWVLVG